MKDLNLNSLQRQTKQWLDRNFPVTNSDDQLIGVTEELGELCHAHLKLKQGIRLNENHYEKRVDAIGDLIIYLCNYCNIEGINLEYAIFNTWNEVRKRNWIKCKTI